MLWSFTTGLSLIRKLFGALRFNETNVAEVVRRPACRLGDAASVAPLEGDTRLVANLTVEIFP